MTNENAALKAKLEKIREWVSFWDLDIIDMSRDGYDEVMAILDGDNHE